MLVGDCDHQVIKEHKHAQNWVDTRSAHLQLHQQPEPVCCLRLVTVLDNLIDSRCCYGTTITIKCSESPIGVQKALLDVAAHHAVLHQAALVGVTCHVLGHNDSRGLTGGNPVTVIRDNGLSNLQMTRNTWLGSYQKSFINLCWFIECVSGCSIKVSNPEINLRWKSTPIRLFGLILSYGRSSVRMYIVAITGRNVQT